MVIQWDQRQNRLTGIGPLQALADVRYRAGYCQPTFAIAAKAPCGTIAHSASSWAGEASPPLLQIREYPGAEAVLRLQYEQ